jgi:hypothetical protein
MSSDTERLTRLEERLIAERSIRKTRDAQVFHRLDVVTGGLEEVSEEMEAIHLSINTMETTLEARAKVEAKVAEDVSKNTATLQRIEGSIKTMKWFWPLLIMLLSSMITLILQNVDLTTTQKIEKAQEPVVKVESK